MYRLGNIKINKRNYSLKQINARLNAGQRLNLKILKTDGDMMIAVSALQLIEEMNHKLQMTMISAMNFFFWLIRSMNK